MQNLNGLPPGAVTRDDLHCLVWQTPMAELARRFGISQRQLTEICKSLDVPYPRSRYWKLRRDGRRVEISQLPEKSPSVPNYIVIQSRRLRPQTDLDRNSDVTKEAVGIPKGRTGPHPVILAWHEERANQAARFRMSLPDWSKCDLRKQAIFERIFREVEANGLRVEPRKRLTSFCVVYESVQIICTLREKNERIRKSERVTGSLWPTLRPSGRLFFKIENGLDREIAIRREWDEKKEQRLETMIPDIVATVLKAGPVLVKLQKRSEELAQQRYEAERLRREEEVKLRVDKNRLLALIDFADRLEVIAKLQRLIEALEQSTVDALTVIGDRPISDWFQWARSHMHTFDPLSKGAAGVFGDISQIKD